MGIDQKMFPLGAAESDWVRCRKLHQAFLSAGLIDQEMDGSAIIRYEDALQVRNRLADAAALLPAYAVAELQGLFIIDGYDLGKGEQMSLSYAISLLQEALAAGRDLEYVWHW
jgi:hypothetical protein